MEDEKDILVKEEPDCSECAYYFITHDAGFPYGCSALDFKSRRKPQQDVVEASGKPCLAFEKRRKAKT